MKIDGEYVLFGDFDVPLGEFPQLVERHLAKCPTTQECEELGAVLVEGAKRSAINEAQALAFITAVCEWGGGLGERKVLPQVLRSWIPSNVDLVRDACLAISDLPSRPSPPKVERALREAIGHFDCIAGLATSFASKMVRFVAPNYSAVMDSVIGRTIGVEPTTESYLGYCDFAIRVARELERRGIENPRSSSSVWRAGDVDQALFACVQDWTASDPNPGSPKQRYRRQR